MLVEKSRVVLTLSIHLKCQDLAVQLSVVLRVGKLI